jgi:methionyl-tRNA formyltransferase
MQISFWGSSDFSLEILKELFKKSKEHKLDLLYVVTQPPKPYGRKRELKHNLVAEFCIENEIPVLLPEKLSQIFNLKAIDQVPALQYYFIPDIASFDISTDISIVAAYGKIISEKVLNTAKYGFINFHGSILPTYRGAIPVQRTVMNQDNTCGITVIKMDKGMDTGDVITSYEFEVEENITSGELMGQLAEVSAKLIDRNFDLIFNPEEWDLRPQDHEKATYCYERDFAKEHFQITYEDGVKRAHGKIMAANPEPKAFVTIFNLQSSIYNTVNMIRSYVAGNGENFAEGIVPSGTLSLHASVDKSKLFLELCDGFLQIVEIQPIGKNVMDARSYINGYLRT